MFTKPVLLTAFVLTLVVSASYAQEIRLGDVIFRDSGISSIELVRDTSYNTPGIMKIETSQTYHFMTYAFYPPNGGMSVSEALIGQRTVRINPSAPWHDDRDSVVTFLTGYDQRNNSERGKARWRDTLAATDVTYGLEFITASFASENVRSLYSYFNGQNIMALTSDFWGLEDPIQFSPRRYIGYFDRSKFDYGEMSSELPPAYTPEGCDDCDGVLTYLDPISGHAQFMHFYVTNDFVGRNTDFRKWEKLKSISIEGLNSREGYSHYSHHEDALRTEHWGYADFNHFDIVLQFDGAVKTTVKIPVRNDKIDQSKVKSKWFEVKMPRK